MPGAAAQSIREERVGSAVAVTVAAGGGPRWPGWATIALFLLPAFAIYAVFVLYPIVQSIRYSLHEWSGISPGFDFVGLENYRTLVRDDVFWKALRNNLILVVASIAIQLPIGLGLALLAEQRLRGWRVFRTVWFLPLLMSTVAIGLLWNYIYDPTFGLLNTALHTFGLDSWQRGWLGEKETALASVIAVICWQYIPFYMVLFIAGLTTIPGDLLEAARLDGATIARCDLPRARFAEAALTGATIDRSDLRHAVFEDAGLAGAKLTRNNLFEAVFDRADLTGASLAGSNAYGCGFWESTLDDLDVAGAIVSGTVLAGVHPT